MHPFRPGERECELYAGPRLNVPNGLRRQRHTHEPMLPVVRSITTARMAFASSAGSGDLLKINQP